ncbi:rod shape-determining protein RodA [Dokdonia sp. Dokd-P16]|uniref:rod shape-determining protein RodA n=1 Tax=Dokdonia sp. Dokd-P16 TaxID=2173169 RepID=UPI000D546235|nr:rod shape-determining protein RodA [Dokdonia sp. Dokd-P16]AWH73283.1 rod shape-determining protein RodA [Dokdonia sp. Dokd-P16]
MSKFSRNVGSFDWVLILLYLALVAIGWVNIYSAAFDPDTQAFASMNNLYFKQLVWIFLGFLIITFILFLDSKFFERFSSVIYIGSLLSLILLFVFGKTISGATSWYNLGFMSLQPSEFAKAATALALAKYLSDIQTNIKTIKDQVRALAIIAIPALIIVPQPDPGSALVYAAFFFPLYREGLAASYLILGASTITLFVLTLVLGPIYVSLIVLVIALILFARNRKKRPSKRLYIGLVAAACLFAFSVNYIFENIFEQRHRDRFNIVLGKEVDAKSIGYNTQQSEIAIGNGGWFGRGFLEGTQTKGKFVPEQHTDYIFSTVGEEWGFLGSTLVIILFVVLILRIIQLSEKQKNDFSRIYGYSLAGILFIHFVVNIGMVIGLLPTVGIPLPFFSYGGSGLWGFTILLFIFVKLDGNRVNEW